jgi:uncharacterized protein (TIGR02246 family)
MSDDEKAIRNLITQWLDASRDGDLATVLTLMSDDVVFMVPGREPFGKQEFAAMNSGMKNMKIEGRSDIAEIKILGDWAWLRNRLQVTITPPGKPPVVRSGYTLTILQKQSDGKWMLTRDANLLT